MGLSELGTAAMEYAARGWSVFPLLTREKEPAITNGLLGATTDPEQIEIWWEAHPFNNVAIALGSAARNIIAIDIDYDEDKGEDGWETLREWEQEHGKLPETVTDLSGRGGGRLYYKVDRPIHNTTNAKIGIDIRGEGGYVVAPPSIHPNGRTYCWENDPDEYDVAEADDNVYDFIEYIRGTRDGRRKKFVLPKGDIGSGSRNDTLFRYACQLQERGDDDDIIFATISGINKVRCKPPLPDSEVETIVNQALNYNKGQRQVSIEAVGGWVPNFADITISKDGACKPKQTLRNYIEVLYNDPALKGVIRFDELDYSPHVVGKLPWSDGPEDRRWRDSDYSQALAYCEQYGLTNKQHVIDAVTVVAEKNRYNPVAEWLDALPIWDGVPRINTLLTDFFGARMSEYNAFALHLFMWGAIARGYEPGTKFDIMPVLVGPQGIKKSMFISRLAVEPGWFDDNFNTVDGVAAAERLRGLWIAEMGELLALKKAREVEAVKAFITSTVDSYRPSYGRMVEQHPRACVFFGSTNKHEFLADRTGNRRFMPIDIFDRPHEPTLDLYDDDFCREYFMQCWAEALNEWRIGFIDAPGGGEPITVSLTIPDWMLGQVKEAQLQHTEEDTRVGMIGEWLEDRWNRNPTNCRVCAIQVAVEALGWDKSSVPQYVTNDVREIMMNDFPEWVPLEKKKWINGYGSQRVFEKVDDSAQKSNPKV